MAHSQSELQVITFAKNLCGYVMTITQKAPKQFRFSLVGRMQSYVLDIVEELYYANDIYVTPASRAGWAQRQAEAGINRSGISTRIGCTSGYGIVWVVVAALPRQLSELCRVRVHRRLPPLLQCQQRQWLCSPRFVDQSGTLILQL